MTPTSGVRGGIALRAEEALLAETPGPADSLEFEEEEPPHDLVDSDSDDEPLKLDEGIADEVDTDEEDVGAMPLTEVMESIKKKESRNQRRRRVQRVWEEKVEADHQKYLDQNTEILDQVISGNSGLNFKA